MNRYFNIFVLMNLGILFSFSGCKDNDVTGVTISPEICVLQVKETKQLTATVLPDNADDKSVRWTVNTLWAIDSDTIATVSENGKVTARAEGAAAVSCITNNMFCEAKTYVMVGYAAAVDGLYSGSLSENEIVLDSVKANMAVRRLSEKTAKFYFPYLSGSIPDGYICEVTVEYISEKMSFKGEDVIDISGKMTPVKVTGTVTLDGLGKFDVFLGDSPVTTYSFMGTNKDRPF